MTTRRSILCLSKAVGALSPRGPSRCYSHIAGSQETRGGISSISARRIAISHSQLHESRRWHSIPPDVQKSKVYSFEDINQLSSAPTPSRILIDVREPAELQGTGTIPTSLNIPIRSQPDALALPSDEFYDRFGFDKPSPEVEVVFYCKSGVRSSAAAQIAMQNGYDKVGEYRGSWLDWEKNGGRKESVS